MDNGRTSTPSRRPSLYAASKLARLVLRVKQRLVSRIKSRTLPDKPGPACHRDDLKIHVQVVNRTRIPRHKGQTYVQSHGLASSELPELLRDLDSYTRPENASPRAVAKDDQLFSKYDGLDFITSQDEHGLRHIVDLTTLLLYKLEIRQQSLPHHRLGKERTCPDLKCEKFIANLQHLLRHLQQLAFEALIRHTLNSLTLETQYLRQLWQRHTCTKDSWSAEWPNGQPPLNTTWPWNVRPSLVVLWGVCWMYYDNETWKRRQPQQGLNENSWTQQSPSAKLSCIPGWSELGISNTIPNSPRSAIAGPENAFDSNIPCLALPSPSSGPLLDSHIYTDAIVTLGNFSRPFLASSPFQQIDPVLQGVHFDFGSRPDLVTQRLPDLSSTAPEKIQPQGGCSPYSLDRFLLSPQLNESALQVPMKRPRNYSSHFSDTSSRALFQSTPSPGTVPSMPLAASSNDIESVQPQYEGSVRGTDIAKSEDDQLSCNHPNCAASPPFFTRQCEYKKHMDKHDRPYICNDPGCEKTQGFTYSGGLLRHKREVHGKQEGLRLSFMCPHTSCKRSSGKGFSRKENLNEHLRRVHRGVRAAERLPTVMSNPDGTPITNITLTSSASQDSTTGTEPKKRRISNEGGRGADEESKSDLHRQVRKLSKEVQLHGQKIRVLEMMCRQLVTKGQVVSTTPI